MDPTPYKRCRYRAWPRHGQTLLGFVEREEILATSHFLSPSHLLQSFNRGNGMTILDARDIAPEKTRSLFDVTLGEFLVLAECAKAITNNHGCSPTRNTCKRVYRPLDKYPRYVFMSTVEELLKEFRFKPQ